MSAPVTVSSARWLAAWGVHLFTASSAPAGVMAIFATIAGDAQGAFLWMAYTLAVDAIDGTFARAVGVKQVLPWFDGARLDDIVDYFTYVVVPVVFVIQMGLVPASMAAPVAIAITVASGYGFSRTDAKTTDHFFTGFPSYWNIVAFYLHALGWAPGTNAAVLMGLAVLVFVPIRYLYPSRTTTLRWLTVSLGIAWSASLLWVMVAPNDTSRAIVQASLAYPVYYVALSLLLQRRQ